MGIEKREHFIGYLDGRTSAVQENINRLLEDNRKDEADFEKIRANIFQMIKTIFQASQRISEEGEEQIKFFDSRLKVIEKTWRTSLAKATEFSDVTRVLQEQVKLEVMDEVRKTFEGLWEV